MSSMLPPSLADFRGVLSETKRLVSGHRRHFLALSVLFLLPLSFSLAVFPTLIRCFSDEHNNSAHHTLLRLQSSSFHLGIPLPTLAFLLIFALSALLLFVSAAASLTYSSFHAFYARPLKLPAALSSLFHNFLLLLATFAAALLYISLPLSLFALYQFLSWKAISLISPSPLHSPYFLAISFLGTLTLALLLSSLFINWILLAAVVVIEKTWGFHALNRSKYLVTPMRTTGLSLLFFWGFQLASLLCLISASSLNHLHNWNLAIHIVLTSAISIFILLHGISAGTVFYIYCKAVKGELDDDIANDYTNFPFDHDDDDKPPLLISLLHQ